MEPFGKPRVESTFEVVIDKNLPKLVVNKTLASDQDSYVKVGDEVDFVIQVRNIGSVEAKDLVVTDSLDSGWSKSLDLLGPGESKGFNFSVVIDQSMVKNGKVVNTAFAVTDGGSGSNVVEAEGSETVFVVDSGVGGVGLEKRLTPGQSNYVSPGSNVSWDIIVTNYGQYDVSDVVVKDVLDGNWSQTISALKAGEVRTLTFSSAVSDKDVTNVATATWRNSDGSVGSSTSSGSTVFVVSQNSVSSEPNAVSGDPDSGRDQMTVSGGTDDGEGRLSVDKRLRVGQSYRVKYGSTVSYDITVSNVGTKVLKDVVVLDSLDSSWRKVISELAPGASEVFLFEYAIPKSGIRNGETISNMASASASGMSSASGSTQSITDVLADDMLFDIMFDEIPQGASAIDPLSVSDGLVAAGVSLPKTSGEFGFGWISFMISFVVVGLAYLVCVRRGKFVVFEF
jgi:uncharacterized repeat protein (TIGR01451 family)